MASIFIITSDSSPVYKDALFSSSPYWDCAEWIKWHEELLKKYTSEEADYIWSKAWVDGVSKVSGGNGIAGNAGYFTDSVPLDCRTFDANFKAFLDSNSNLKAAVFSGVGGLIARPVSLGVTVVDASGNIISNTVKGFSNFSSVLKWLVPLVLILVVIGLFIYANKKYKLV